ncbi:UNVERIFIED_CONTAM: hypothetical protein FKN15_030687 [Acipenser sinensis]
MGAVYKSLKGLFKLVSSSETTVNVLGTGPDVACFVGPQSGNHQVQHGTSIDGLEGQ